MSVESASSTTKSTITTSATADLAPRPKATTRVNVTTSQRYRWIANNFYYQLMATLTLVLFWFFFENSASNKGIFTTHLVLSTVAYIPLMAVSIILFSEDNVTTLYLPRTKRNWIHGILLIFSAVFVTIGIAVEIYDKGSKRRHFTSRHAIYGLTSWILIFVSLLLGVIAANTRTFSNIVRPIVAKFIHNFLGLSAFALGIASIYVELGFFTFYEHNMSDELVIAVKTLFILLSVWSSCAALYSLAHQFLGMFR